MKHVWPLTLVVQKALKVVANWPWYPDTLAMTNSLAAKYNATSARVLLDIDSIPPALAQLDDMDWMLAAPEFQP